MTGGPHFDVSVLTTAYLPPVEYFFAVAHSDRVLVEAHEAYQKQSWRNRCRILATAGPEDLSIPVVKEERLSRPIRDIRIDYGEPWLQHHIRAFAAAYNHSAFYDYYADDLIPILESKPAFLFDLNMALLEKLLVLLGLDTPVSLTESFEASPAQLSPVSGEEKNVLRRPGGEATVLQGEMPRALEVLASRERDVFLFDGRDRIKPKYKGESLLAEFGCEQAYYQVFVNQAPGAGFIPNLSILDLLSAEGPDAGRFLRI